jgi:hypothetical protein
MLIKSLSFVLFLSYTLAQSLSSEIEELKFMNNFDQEEILKSETIKKLELFDVRCFWINGFNIYDIEGLENSKE